MSTLGRGNPEDAPSPSPIMTVVGNHESSFLTVAFAA